jgi:hypothetical protein
MFWYSPWGGIYMLIASRTVIGFATGNQLTQQVAPLGHAHTRSIVVAQER